MAKSVRYDPEVAANGYVTPREEYFMRGASPVDAGQGQQSKESRLSAPFPHLHNPNPHSLAKMIADARKVRHGKSVGLRDRLCFYQWTWFTMTMATGGISNVLHTLYASYRSDWLYYIGLVFFLFNVCLFVMNCVCITLRFHFVPGTFMHSFNDQTESLFIPSVLVSAAIIMINICEYGIPRSGFWLQQVVELLFWVYIGVSFTASAAMYLILWSTQVFPIHTMTPVWVFPAYPLLLTAPFASNIISQSSDQTPINKVSIAFAAITIQGTGFLISFMVCAAFLYRLMTQKLPRDMQRPGVFISIGPSGFTCAGVVALGSQTSDIIPDDFKGGIHAVYILQLLSMMVGLWLWGLSLWFFLVSVGSLHKYLRKDHKMPFQMTWWSFVFPNTALVTATVALATALESEGLKIFGCVMAAALIIVWIFVFICMIRALWKRELLWPEEADSN